MKLQQNTAGVKKSSQVTDGYNITTNQHDDENYQHKAPRSEQTHYKHRRFILKASQTLTGHVPRLSRKTVNVKDISSPDWLKYKSKEIHAVTTFKPDSQ